MQQIPRILGPLPVPHSFHPSSPAASTSYILPHSPPYLTFHPLPLPVPPLALSLPLPPPNILSSVSPLPIPFLVALSCSHIPFLVPASPLPRFPPIPFLVSLPPPSVPLAHAYVLSQPYTPATSSLLQGKHKAGSQPLLHNTRNLLLHFA